MTILVPLETGMNTLSKQVQTVPLEPNYVSTLPGKTKNSTKTANRGLLQCVCSTDCSKLSQKVVQCSLFIPHLLENSFSCLLTKISFTFSWVLSKIYLQTQHGYF